MVAVDGPIGEEPNPLQAHPYELVFAGIALVLLALLIWWLVTVLRRR